MSDKKISELTALTAPDGAEELVVNDSGTSKKITQTNLLSTALPLAGGTMTGTIAGFTSTGIDDNATSTAITIASDEKVAFSNNIGVGTGTPRSSLDLGPYGNGREISWHSSADRSYTNIWSSYSGARLVLGGNCKGSTTVPNGYESSLPVTINAQRSSLEVGGGGVTFKTAPATTTAYGSPVTMNTAMTIDNNGDLEAGTFSAVGASVGWICQTGSNANTPSIQSSSLGASTRNHYVFYNENGAIGTIQVSGSATSYNTSSDYRLKENVVPMTGSIDRLKDLKPSRFNFKADTDTTVDGFLAHEAGEVVPECASGTKDAMMMEEYEVTPEVKETVTIPEIVAVEAVLDADGNITTEAVQAQDERTEERVVTEAVMGEREVPDYQGIDQSKLVPLLVASLQEAIARIETLENA